ncbi:iron-sulfur cluster binding protein [Lacticaseibacillus paracasei subsp. paracasei Lpp219]|nr:iron-sulfur cluster binding protein [Lacticaseibacillus paracasei subsp. paracasei Lpp219]
MSIVTSDKPFLERVKESEQDKFMQASVAKAQDAQWDKREASRHELGNWPQWRDLGEQIRQHVIKYLPDYLEEFSDNVEKRAGMFTLPKRTKKPRLTSRTLPRRSRPRRL